MIIVEKKFGEINLNDRFFDSLREDYEGFDKWFLEKKNAIASILETTEGIQAFLYTKEEVNEEDKTINPSLGLEKILKVGTFKINPHGTKLGERFIKLIFDEMIEKGHTKAYVTIFEKHKMLLELLKKYGFEYWGLKNGTEQVYVKNLENLVGDIQKDYPLINLKRNNKFLLSIYPKYHTELFPDSKLMTEKGHVVKDLSHTNCIEKIYLSGSQELSNYKKGDIVVIYRTAENGKVAEYNAVATSVCTIKEIKNINSFSSREKFLEFCKDRTIFKDWELEKFWKEKKYPYIIILLYNTALNKRIIRKDLIEKVGIERNARIVTYPLTDIQIDKILEFGKSNNKNLIIK